MNIEPYKPKYPKVAWDKTAQEYPIAYLGAALKLLCFKTSENKLPRAISLTIGIGNSPKSHLAKSFFSIPEVLFIVLRFGIMLREMPTL